MKPRISAKKLTAKYFGFVAVAIILIHFSVFELTTDNLETTYAKNRLEALYLQTKQTIQKHQIKNVESLQNNAKHSEIIHYHSNLQLITNANLPPLTLPNRSDLKLNKVYELEGEDDQLAIYAIKKSLKLYDKTQYELLFLIDNSVYEQSEEQVMISSGKQMLVTLLLMAISLVVVFKISERLTKPIAKFASQLSKRDPKDSNTPITLEGNYTQELDELLQTFNRYQTQINELIERERAFNRYASHELRSPLMVIRGVGALLKECQEPEFIEKQRQRLVKACEEMSEFIESLLSLTRPTEHAQLAAPLLIDHDLLNQIVASHQHLIQTKAIDVTIHVHETASIKIPPATFSILLGNLIKNAFTYTEHGQVVIEVNAQVISVTDTGLGLEQTNETAQGFGLGLLLVKETCRQFDLDFTLDKVENTSHGTIAKIYLPQD